MGTTSQAMRFQSSQAERFQFAGHQDEVGEGKFLVHIVLLAEKKYIVVNALLHGQPLRARAVGAIADQ